MSINNASTLSDEDRAPRSMLRLRHWWWPGFAFVYPLLWAPWSNGRLAAYTVHITFALAALVGALGLAWYAHRRVPLREVARRLRGLLVRPPVVLVLAFVGWTWVSALASPDPGFALTGSMTELSNGAYEFLLFSVIFIMVYAQAKAEALVARRIGWAVVASGAVLAILAIVEVVTHHAENLPMVAFPQKGHLAGMLALAAGITIGTGSGWLAFLIAVGIGLTVNRSAAAAILPVVLLVRPRRAIRIGVTLVVILLGVGSGIWVVRHSQLGVAKTVVSSSTLVSRSYLYLASLRGIAARPILGWGGGVFELHWTDFLSLSELSRFAKDEFGIGPVLKVLHSAGGYPVLVVQEAVGSDGATTKVGFASMAAWHSHNQFLEIGLQTGLVGLLLYVVLFGLGVRGVWRGNPLGLGLLAYFIFLQFWFVIPETRGVLWVVWAAAIASSARTRLPVGAPSDQASADRTTSAMRS